MASNPRFFFRLERAVLVAPLAAFAVAATGCAVVNVASTAVGVAGSAAGAAVSVVGSTVKVAGKVVEKTVDLAIPGGAPAAAK